MPHRLLTAEHIHFIITHFCHYKYSRVMELGGMRVCIGGRQIIMSLLLMSLCLTGRVKNFDQLEKELPCAVCVFVYALKPESCFLAFQFEELRCSSNQISCACLESVQFSVFDSFKINITSHSYYIQRRELCHIIHLIVNNM